MTDNVQKTAGVMGGMGPDATVDFMSRVLRETPAKADQDHVRMVVEHNPRIPSRQSAMRGDGENPGPVIAATSMSPLFLVFWPLLHQLAPIPRSAASTRWLILQRASTFRRDWIPRSPNTSLVAAERRENVLQSKNKKQGPTRMALHVCGVRSYVERRYVTVLCHVACHRTP